VGGGAGAIVVVELAREVDLQTDGALANGINDYPPAGAKPAGGAATRD
jgi:hypothetical protein